MEKAAPYPGSYEMFLQTRAGNGKNNEDGGYDYVSAPMDTWDSGSLYRMHMIRHQAAIDLTHKPEEGDGRKLPRLDQ